MKKLEQMIQETSVEHLINLPETYDDRIISLITMLMTMLDIAYFINQELYLENQIDIPYYS